jgi:hypothetical protein
MSEKARLAPTGLAPTLFSHKVTPFYDSDRRKGSRFHLYNGTIIIVSRVPFRVKYRLFCASTFPAFTRTTGTPWVFLLSTID